MTGPVSMRTELRLDNVSKIYPSAGADVVALAETSLSLKPGTLTGIIGPSGSGKTTMLMIAGVLEPPSTGRVIYGEQVISQPNAELNALRDFRRNNIGFVFQKANLIPFLNAFDNVRLALEINDVHGRAATNRVHSLLESLDVAHRYRNFPRQLSGGEQQRIAIARALANNPSVLLADEPTASLDGNRSTQIMKLFRGLADTQGVAVCVVTHDHRWLDLFDVVLELEDGRAVSRNR
ncbi:MAG: ABC transporter ATP-binding protein [Rhizobiaceae bacterium]